jgi:hypothetical protein
MVLWNLLDGRPSHSRHLLGPFESMRGGTLGTNPRHLIDKVFQNLVHMFN